MHGDAHIERLRSAAAGVAIRKALANGCENLVVPGDFLSQDRGTGLFKHLTDPFAAGNFAGAGMPSIIREDHQVSGEEGRVRSTQVQQHTVAARNRNHSHAGYAWGGPNVLHERKYLRSIRSIDVFWLERLSLRERTSSPAPGSCARAWPELLQLPSCHDWRDCYFSRRSLPPVPA